MSAQQKAALRGGGEYNLRISESYPIARRSSTLILEPRLSPRRKLCAERLLEYLHVHGRKVYFDRRRYANLACAPGLDRFAANQAIDDLCALGLVNVRMIGDMQVVRVIRIEQKSPPLNPVAKGVPHAG